VGDRKLQILAKKLLKLTHSLTAPQQKPEFQRWGRRLSILIICFAFLLGAPVFAPGSTVLAESHSRVGRYSKQPLPRFASIKANRANLRRGPGIDYAVIWELRRRGLPVRIVGEHGNWRRVELHDQTRGWLHQILLSPKRTATAKANDTEIYATPRPDGRLVARIAVATPLLIRSCTLEWCLAERGGLSGWTLKRRLWGVDDRDVF
jgi:SH3-like domain-containing protein